MGHLGQRRHSRDHVPDLEPRLLPAQNALLARDHDHEHRAEHSVGGTCRQIKCAGTQRGQADSGPARKSAMRGRYERISD